MPKIVPTLSEQEEASLIAIARSPAFAAFQKAVAWYVEVQRAGLESAKDMAEVMRFQQSIHAAKWISNTMFVLADTDRKEREKSEEIKRSPIRNKRLPKIQAQAAPGPLD